MNRKSLLSGVLVSLLILSTAVVAVSLFATATFGQEYYEAWLKIVTSAWKGTPDTTLPGVTPVMPTGTTFPERYNVTNVCVEVWRIKQYSEDYGGVFSVNGTGFVKVKWPKDWENVTIVVKAKSYQGECIGQGNLYSGIIVYWLTVNSTEPFKKRLTGATWLPPGANATVNDDGIVDTWGNNWQIQTDRGRAGLSSGPVDFLDWVGGFNPAWFAGNFSDPRNAWVARAAYIFKVFHEHTWYSVKDNLTYAIIFIYDVDHTAANSVHSLLQAAITGSDGQSRYTREIYPTSVGVGTGRFAQNKFVPIPLQIMNLRNGTAFHGGIGAPTTSIRVGAPHLNATKRVWWETVLTNQTFYVGREYNGTDGYATNFGGTEKTRPLFGAFPANPALNPTITQGGITGVPAGPLSIALNYSIHTSTGPDGFDTWGAIGNITKITNFNNNTVFYARFCVQDADLNIQHPEVGDKLVNAEVTINLKSKPEKPYYLSHNILSTDNGGCTDDPHKWPGYLPQYSKFARFPNATNWGLRGSLNVSKHFFPIDDETPAWSAGGYFERAWGGAWDGPWVNAGKNWSALIPMIDYMKTRTLTDDPDYDGFDVQVKWKGGSRNAYGGTAVLVDSVRVENPYGIAATNTTTYNGWITPTVTLANNTALIKIHSGPEFTIAGKLLKPPVTLMLSSETPFTISLANYDPDREVNDVRIIAGTKAVVVYIVENATRAPANIPAGQTATIEDVSVTIKFHDAKTNAYFARVNVPILGASIDVNVDGVPDSYGPIAAGDALIASGEVGVAEVEFWPGPPGTGTFRALFSTNNTDFFIYNDYTGAALVKDGFPSLPWTGDWLSFSVASRSVVELQPLAPNEAPDIALSRTGIVFITAKVYDIAFELLDNMGNTLPASNTEVRLIRTNGPDVVKAGGGFDPDRLVGGLQWSYKMHGDGWAVFYQLPGKYAYDVQVFFDGNLVYDEAGWEIPKLEKTEFITIVANVFKVKLVFQDCSGQELPNAYVKYINQAGREITTLIDPHGALDLGYTAAGTITVKGLWYKGVWVTFLEASIGENKLELNPDGTLTVTIDKNVDSPIILKANIFDIVLTPWDFNKDVKIPRLNITLTWVGEHPLTGKKLWFLETLNATGNTIDNPFNTSVTVDQFLSYEVRYFQSIPTELDELKAYEVVKYVFYKMPPTYYNITVTTVTRGDLETVQTPGNSKWPGRTDAPVPYEIKILYTSTSSPPTEITEPAATVNDRVVLRVISTLNPESKLTGEPVVSEALNPANVGDFTGVKVCRVERDLLTWAHTFWKSVIDGELRVGDALYRVVNDNGWPMEFYNPKTGRFEGSHISFWTEDVRDATWLKKRSQFSSTIWWNGSYKLSNLTFRTNMTYSYAGDHAGKNASFIVDKFYNASAVNDVAPTLNFTLVGTEELWKTDRRFPLWKARITGNTWKDWYDAWFLVYELPKDTDEYKVPKGPDGKGLLPIPLPVAFIKLGAFAKGGEPLNKALIELWTLHMDVNTSVKISAKDEDCKTTYLYVPTYKPLQVCWKWETKPVETTEPQVYDLKRWDRVWLTFTTESNTKTIYVQVPPSPAKLILRDVVDDVDVAVSADYVYPLITATPRDNNVGVDDKWGEEDGILSYGRWYTESDGYIKSFKALGAADPRYGSIVLPIAGWLNDTFHDGVPATKDEFHYQINIVWKSAVVYSDNLVLDKTGYETKPSEVYTVTFYLALSNSTKAPVRGLNAWIYYPNVTEWRAAGYWNGVPPTPQDYEACKDSAFKCKLRVTLASEAWADGKKTFDLIPGPRFMNTTWKYVFSANHTAIDWMDDLVATQFVLNNETFGDDGLRVKTTTRIDVPIMLNAARWVVFEVATWRDEAGIPTAYPMKDYTVRYEIRKPKYLTGPALTAASGSATTDAEGKVVLTSDPSDPRKVFWAGMVVRYRVEPPTYTSDYAADYWKQWLTARGVEFVDKKTASIPSIMSHAYYPDEEPTHFAVVKIETPPFEEWPERPEGGRWCVGLCVHEYRSKPFFIWVDYTAVTVRVTDFNGRPLAGAFVQLWDKASGKLAAWHYTAATEWNALPLDVAKMIEWHGLDVATDTVKIPFQTKPRTFGGAGFTGVMNVTVGPVEFDTNNDDRIDVSLPYRGIPGKPGTSFITYIARAFWLSTAEPTTIKGGKVTLKPVWPYLPNIAPKVYDSEEDEVTWKLLLPRYVAGAAFRPGMALYYPQVLNIPSAAAPTGALVKEHRDVFAHVFNLEMNLRYEGKPLAEILKLIRPEEFVVRFIKAYDEVKFLRNDTIKIEELPRGTYTVIVEFKGKEVARRTIDLSTVNVGTVTADIPLAMRDVSIQVVDIFGRPLAGVKVGVSPNYYAVAPSTDTGGILTIRGIVTTEVYTFEISWRSPKYGTEAKVIIADTPDGLAARKTIELPVGTVTVRVVDRKGEPIAGAIVKFGPIEEKTDSAGNAYFEGVPLEAEGKGIGYDISVVRDGFTVFSGKETVSRSKTTITVIGELFSLKVRVVGAAGQGLPFAKVVVKRAGAEIGTFTTDAGGFLEITKLPLSDYTVEAEWKGFRGEAAATRDDLMAGRAVEISLPPYIEIAGVPFTFSAFLGLIIGLIILVIVLVIISSEYIRWRGRRLGIYPPPPPKK